MHTPIVPDGFFLDEENPTLALNTYHKDLATFLSELNYRRLRVAMLVDVLSVHNKAVIASGIILEIIAPQEFAGETGQFHEAIITVKLTDKSIKYYSANRIIPISGSQLGDDIEQEIHTPTNHERHRGTQLDD